MVTGDFYFEIFCMLHQKIHFGKSSVATTMVIKMTRISGNDCQKILLFLLFTYFFQFTSVIIQKELIMAKLPFQGTVFLNGRVAI